MSSHPTEDESPLDALLEISRKRRLDSGEVLFREGSEGSELFLILTGRLKVSTSGGDGRELVLRIMDPGEVIGEIALLDGKRRSATITALDRVELLVIRRSDLLDLLQRRPEVALKLLELAATRLRDLSELYGDTSLRRLPARLARRLIALARKYGRRGPAGLHIELAVSQQDLGEMVATSRESVNKQIRVWSEACVLTMNRGAITIQDELALARVAR